MRKKKLMRSAAILSIAGIIVKILGAFFKIPIVNMIGDLGMSSFTPAYNIYSFFLAFSTAGFPVAISRLISENVALGKLGDAQNVFKVSQYIMTVIGVISFCVVLFSAELVANKIGLPNSSFAIKSIAPALIFVPIMASFRGYFQGMHDMKPTAISQIVEQGLRVFFGLALAYMMFHEIIKVGEFPGLPETRGAAGATFGTTMGAIGGLIYIYIIYLKKGKKYIKNIDNDTPRDVIKNVKKIVVIAFPITVGAILMPVMGLVDAGIVNLRLISAGMSSDDAIRLYGQLTGFAGPLVNLPQVFIQAIAVSLVPIISEWNAKFNITGIKNYTQDSCKLALIIALPCAMGLIVLAEPILILIYPGQIESAISTAQCLKILSTGIVFLAITQTLTSILQGIGKQKIPVYNLFLGIIVKVVITWCFVPIIGVNGAALGTVAAYLLAMILNIVAVKKLVRAKWRGKEVLVKPFICTSIMGVFSIIIFHGLSVLLGTNGIVTMITILFDIILYIFLLFITNTVKRNEILNLPGGIAIDKIIRNINFFKKYN